MGRRIVTAVAAAAAVLSGAAGATAAGATTAGLQGIRASQVPQTLGMATLYGTSTPVGVGAAGKARTRAGSGVHAEHFFTRRASTPRSAVIPGNLRPPSPAGIPVVTALSGATGFNGLSARDQRFAGTGAWANSQPDLEPPDQGLCVGNGFVVEPVNVAFAVYNEHGKALTGVTSLNQFYRKKPFVNRRTGVVGAAVADPRCYYDPAGKRFIQTIAEADSASHIGTPPFTRTHLLIAVSKTSNPAGAWNLYSIDTTDDGTRGTPAHAGCPCLPDEPLLGANSDGIFVDINEFQLTTGLFNGDQTYALGRAALESGAAQVRFDHLDARTVPTGDPNLPFWASIQPTTSPHPGAGSELLMSGGPVDMFQNFPAMDDRIAVWSLTGTRSLGTAKPHLGLHHIVLTSEAYGLAVNTGATQKPGPTPLRDSLGDVDPLEKINANDSRMNQVTDAGGVLYGGVNTAVKPATGPSLVGIAFFAVAATTTSSGVTGHIVHQGYVAASGANLLFPSIAITSNGTGAMCFTLSGPRFFPSAAYLKVRSGQPAGLIHISGPGARPEDGFSGYKNFHGHGVARWGDYSAATIADGAIWLGSENIPSTPRTKLANWGTFLTRVPLP